MEISASSTEPIISECVGETQGLANQIVVERLQDVIHVETQNVRMWRQKVEEGHKIQFIRNKSSRNRCADISQDGGDDDDDDGVLVSTETGSAGSAERGEPLPQSHGRHTAGEAPQSALGTLGPKTPPLASALISSTALRMCCQQ